MELHYGTTVPIVCKPLERPPEAVNLPSAKAWEAKQARVDNKVKVAKITNLPPLSQTFVTVTAKSKEIYVIQPKNAIYDEHHILTANGVVDVNPNHPFRILIANLSQYRQALVKHQVVANLLPHPTATMDTKLFLSNVLDINESESRPGPPLANNARQTSDGAFQKPIRVSVTNETAHYSPESPPTVKDLDLEHVPTSHRENLLGILRNFSHVWDGSLGAIRATEQHIDLIKGPHPISFHPYRAGLKSRAVEEMEVERMPDANVIERAQSVWASPVVLAPKPDGSLRFCVDYRCLSALTVKDTYPLSRMDECIDSLVEANISTTLNFNSGYWQIPVSHRDRDKTAFFCHSGLYRYKRMPYALTNAPETFQQTLDILLSRYKWKSCFVYSDDVIIFSRSLDSHISHVEQVLSSLSRAGVTLKLKKCEFFTKEVR